LHYGAPARFSRSMTSSIAAARSTAIFSVTGRNFHFTLVNLAKHGRIVNKGGDTYEAAEPLPSMFGAGMEGGLMKRIM
jgi:hypothetical protein